MTVAHSADVDLDDVIAEITIDCFNEDEQLQAFENAFDEHAEFPCPGSVIGEHVEILSAATRSNRRDRHVPAPRTHLQGRAATSRSTPTRPPRAYSPRTAAGAASDATGQQRFARRDRALFSLNTVDDGWQTPDLEGRRPTAVDHHRGLLATYA
jgi:hypothetical protein